MAPQLKLKGYNFSALFQVQTLQQLDQHFLATLKTHNNKLYEDLCTYRQGKTFSAQQISELLIACSKPLENFIAQLFTIENALLQSRQQTLSYQAIFTFKKQIVLRQAKRRLLRQESLPHFTDLHQWLQSQIAWPQAKNKQELIIAKYAKQLLSDTKKYTKELEKLTQWCIQAIKTTKGQAVVKDWISFKLPTLRDYEHLVPIIPVNNDKLKRQQSAKPLKERDGFSLTDKRMSLPQIVDELHYCIYCHQNGNDYCSKGFLKNKNDASQGYRYNPLNNLLTGCPLEEKISEMQLLKRDGYTIAALAMIMIDNPMCPMTGHRICNDCMKSCIYQKQEAVNIPEIETRVLTDVLDLPWGVEIYDLLTRWHPLRRKQWIAKPYNGLNILIAGSGPAGLTMAHHLLMAGCAVVAIDGLKIEPLPKHLIDQPIYRYHDLVESLDKRTTTGFGGVAEYGITARWDKNFLKLIYLNLMRRPHFQLFGNVRFGGTITVEDAWDLGFDHVSMAVGAGLPQALAIDGSLAPGMRQANDFLMALQLTGAAKNNTMANLQLRLPAIVIGGGLTGIDTATEAQAYYIKQVERTLTRYEMLSKHHNHINKAFDSASQAVLAEFLAHGQAVREERQRAKAEKRAPNFIKLIRQWGGVTIVYRKRLQQSPAYITNHEELDHALQQGIYYHQQLQPQKALLDCHGHINALVCSHRDSNNPITLAARTILVATGAKLNIAYEFEHRGTFKRNGWPYQGYQWSQGKLNAIDPTHAFEYNKQAPFGPFTSYNKNHHYVSFIGDSHPNFHGSVVKAIASATRTYPQILALLAQKAKPVHKHSCYQDFAKKMAKLFTAQLIAIQHFDDDIVELTLHAPMAVKKFQAGQFFRLQNFETQPIILGKQKLQMQALPLIGFDANKKAGTIKLMATNASVSQRLCHYLKAGDNIALMGPTGVRSKIPSHNTLLIVGQKASLAYIRAVGPALRAKGNRIIYLGHFDNASTLYCQKAIEQCCDICIWSTTTAEKIMAQRPQDFSLSGDAMSTLFTIGKQHPQLLAKINRITVIGNSDLLRQWQNKTWQLSHLLKQSPKIFASVYGPMQCMLKGICAQCLQWQIDPHSKKRTKAVFACSWQDQPLEFVDIDHLAQRLVQNNCCEKLNDLWLDYLLNQQAS